MNFLCCVLVDILRLLQHQKLTRFNVFLISYSMCTQHCCHVRERRCYNYVSGFSCGMDICLWSISGLGIRNYSLEPIPEPNDMLEKLKYINIYIHVYIYIYIYINRGYIMGGFVYDHYTWVRMWYLPQVSAVNEWQISYPNESTHIITSTYTSRHIIVY